MSSFNLSNDKIPSYFSENVSQSACDGLIWSARPVNHFLTVQNTQFERLTLFRWTILHSWPSIGLGQSLGPYRPLYFRSYTRLFKRIRVTYRLWALIAENKHLFLNLDVLF